METAIIRAYLTMPGMVESLTETAVSWLEGQGILNIALYGETFSSDLLDDGTTRGIVGKLLTRAAAGIVAGGAVDCPPGLTTCPECVGTGYDGLGELCNTCGGRGCAAEHQG